MKSFNEFWDSISEDDFSAMVDGLNQKLENFRSETEEPSNLFVNQIVGTSLYFTRELLARYHQWLFEQLG